MLRSLFIAVSCAISHAGPDLFAATSPPTSPAAAADAQAMVALTPMIDQLRTLGTLCELETLKVLRNDIQPLLQPSSPDEPPVDPDKVTRDIRAKMLDTLCDLRVKGTPEGNRAWEFAVRKARRREKESAAAAATVVPPEIDLEEMGTPVVKREPVGEEVSTPVIIKQEPVEEEVMPPLPANDVVVVDDRLPPCPPSPPISSGSVRPETPVKDSRVLQSPSPTPEPVAHLPMLPLPSSDEEAPAVEGVPT
jgi:hypothetical protein